MYEISRSDLERGEIRLLKNQNDFEIYDIYLAIKDFDVITQNVLSGIIEKFLKKKFKNQGKYYNEFQQLEIVRNGSIVIGNHIIEFKK